MRNYFLSIAFCFVLGLSAGCVKQPSANTNAGSGAHEKPRVSTAIRFDDGTQSSNIIFQHVPTRTENKWMPEVMGSGVALVDVNRDGAPDVVLINSGAVNVDPRPAEARNRLYLNDGRGHFTDQTDAWNLPGTGYGMGVAVGDYDNDGWPDLFLTSYRGRDVLLRNTGTRFEDVTDKARITPDDRWSTSAGFADFDNDGDLDLFVERYINYTPENAVRIYLSGVHIYSAPLVYDAVPDRLLRNNGDGTFTDISQESGITNEAGKGLAIAIGDIDLDGDQDVYVANDLTPGLLWLNDGHGKFKNVAPLSGVAYSETGMEQGSMGADIGDLNDDGRLEIVVTNFQTETTSIYRQDAPLLFREVSDIVGVGASARARLKFGVDLFDADNDGDEDLLVANGHIEDNIDQRSTTVSFAQQNTLYENLGQGRFVDISDASGPALLDKQVSRGLAVGDLDTDGDLDFIVNNNGGRAQVGLNVTEPHGGFVGMWLEGRKANRSAIGARLVARAGDRTIQRQVMGASSYLSINDQRVLLGLGAATTLDELTIYWPGSAPQTIKNLAAGRYYHIVEQQEPTPFVPGEQQLAP
jgi:hypothetical protein